MDGPEPADGRQVRIRERLIQAVRREVEVQHLGEQHEGVHGLGELLDVSGLLLAAVRVSPINVDRWEDSEVLRISATACRVLLKPCGRPGQSPD